MGGRLPARMIERSSWLARRQGSGEKLLRGRIDTHGLEAGLALVVLAV